MEFSASINKLLGIILSLRRKGLLTKSGMTDAELDEFKEFFNKLPLNEPKESLVLFLLLNSELPFKLSYFSDDKNEEENLSQFICISPQLSFEITLEIISKFGLNYHLVLATKSCLFSDTYVLFYEMKEFINNVELLCEIFKFFTNKVHHALVFKQGTIKNDDVETIYGYSLIESAWETILDRLMVHLNDSLIHIKVPIGEAVTKFFLTTFLLLTKFLTFNGYSLKSNPMFWFFRIIRKGLYQVHTKMTPEFWKYLSLIYLENEPIISAQEIVGETIYNFFHCFSNSKEVVKTLDLDFLNKFKIYPKRRLVRLMELEKFNLKTWSEALSLYLKPVQFEGPGYKELKDTDPFKCEKFIDFGLEFVDEFDEEFMNEILSKCMNVLNEIEEPHLELKIKKLFIKFLALWNDMKKSDTWDFTRTFYVTYPKLEGKFQVQFDSAEMDDFNEKLTKTFNQISSEKSINLNELLGLCILSKERTLTALCRSALSDANRLDFYADLIEALKFCFLRQNPAFEDASPTLLERELEKMLVNEFSEKETLVLNSFLEKLATRKLINWTFLKKNLSLFHSNIMSEEYDKALCFLSYLDTAWCLVPVNDLNVVFIMYMAQALEKLSWNLETFSSVKCQAIEIVTKIINKIPCYVSNNEDTGTKSLNWALENISCYSEITQSYFVKFWEHLDRDWCPVNSTFSTFVLHLIHSGPNKKRIIASIGERCLNDVNESLALSLAMVLPRLPTSLWDKLYENLVIFYEDSYDVDGRSEALKLYSTFLYLLTLILNRNRKIFACYRYCVTNFGKIFQRAISESPKVNFQEVVKSAVFFLQAIADDDLRENCSMAFLPVFTDFVNGCSQLNISHLVKVLGVNKIEQVICDIEKNCSEC